MAKKKRVISEAQKLAMAEGRRKAKEAKLATAPVEDDEFKPTAVQEAEAAGTLATEDGFSAPAATGDVEDTPEASAPAGSQPMPALPQVDMNLVATIVAAMQAVNAQHPEIKETPPEAKVDEISKRLTPAEANRARISAGGGVQGIVYRYELAPSYYPDPTARLLDEVSLKRFALHENYFFKWEVSGETYEKNGVTFAEPRFIVELYQRLYDDEGQPMLNPQTGRSTVSLVARQIQHEDEFTTRIAAQRLGILDDFSTDDEGFRKLMDEIRYWRIQQWLFGIFRPVKINQFSRQARQQVINGKNVEVFDTEQLTDHDSGVSAASTLQTQAGIGDVRVPEHS